MSLLTPVNIPPKVYRSTDTGAPQLDKSTGCIGTILKACLAIGYGSKIGAGWELTHEDPATKSKVFGVNSGIGAPISLRIYNDAGGGVNIQIVKDVVDANTATTITESNYRFKYSTRTSGKWTLIATQKSFWFFASVFPGFADTPDVFSGSFLFAGVVPGMSSDAILLKHTGGSSEEVYADKDEITSTRSGKYANCVLYQIQSQLSAIAQPRFLFDGSASTTTIVTMTPLYFSALGDVYQLPVYAPSSNHLQNFDVVSDVNAINFCTSHWASKIANNTYVPIDNWVY